MHHWFKRWRRGFRHNPHLRRRDTVWLLVNNFAVELKPFMENEMAQALFDNQVDNLSIAVADASGNAIPAVFDAPPQWAITGGDLVVSDDGTTAVLTPAAGDSTVTVSLTAIIGGTTFTASLDVAVTTAPPVAASITIVATAAPKP